MHLPPRKMRNKTYKFTIESKNCPTLADISLWRDSKGNEIDLLQTVAGDKFAYEIKAGQTASSDYFNGLMIF